MPAIPDTLKSKGFVSKHCIVIICMKSNELESFGELSGPVREKTIKYDILFILSAYMYCYAKVSEEC